MRATPISPPPHTLPLYTTIPLPIVNDDQPPPSMQRSLDSPQRLSPRVMLPSPPQSPPWSGAPPLSSPNRVHTMPTDTVLSNSNPVYLHPILESAVLIPPRTMHEPRRPLPADVNNHLSDPATNPGLGFLTIILLPSGRHVPVQPSSAGRGIITLGDVLQVLRDLNAASLEERNIVGTRRAAPYMAQIVDQETQENANRGPMAKGLWTWVVGGEPVAGYLTIGVEDVAWPRR